MGSVFIYASIDKIVNPGDFAKIVGNYHVLPFGIENLLAIILPWVEFIAGVCLIVGVMVDGATILVILMNIVFIFAITQALARGISVECGCFSVASDTGSAIGVKTILRDIGYLFFLVILFVHIFFLLSNIYMLRICLVIRTTLIGTISNRSQI